MHWVKVFLPSESLASKGCVFVEKQASRESSNYPHKKCRMHVKSKTLLKELSVTNWLTQVYSKKIFGEIGMLYGWKYFVAGKVFRKISTL